MRIAQITDSHIVAEGTLWKDTLDTSATLARAVDALNRIEPDLVVHTGDLVDDGLPEQYAHAVDLLTPLKPPLRLLPGNHDAREPMRAAFPDQAWDGDFLQFREERDGLRILGLDTLQPGETGGHYCDARRTWLAEHLAPAQPTLIFLHHPPAPMGLPFMDQWPFEETAALAALLAEQSDVLRLACGHVHTTAERHWAGTLISATPALSIQIPALQPYAVAPPIWRAGGQAIRLYDWSTDDGLRVTLIPLDEV
ncbi:MAG: metallophosphoesterase [Pseudomonadota bacterium]